MSIEEGDGFGRLNLARLLVVTERMREQVMSAGSTARVHEEDILEAARIVRRLSGLSKWSASA